MSTILLTRADDGLGEESFGSFDSIRWAFETHVKETDTGRFNAAVLYGSEDYPYRIDFFEQAEVDWTDKPARRWFYPEEQDEKEVDG